MESVIPTIQVKIHQWDIIQKVGMYLIRMVIVEYVQLNLMMSMKSQKKEDTKNLQCRMDFISSQIRENRIQYHMLLRELQTELDLYKAKWDKENKK